MTVAKTLPKVAFVSSIKFRGLAGFQTKPCDIATSFITTMSLVGSKRKQSLSAQTLIDMPTFDISSRDSASAFASYNSILQGYPYPRDDGSSSIQQRLRRVPHCCSHSHESSACTQDATQALSGNDGNNRRPLPNQLWHSLYILVQFAHARASICGGIPLAGRILHVR